MLAGIIFVEMYETANKGNSRVDMFMYSCGKSDGANKIPCKDKPATKPKAVAPAPKNKNKVAPNIKWTSDTPSGYCGRTSKKEKTKIVVIRHLTAVTKTDVLLNIR